LVHGACGTSNIYTAHQVTETKTFSVSEKPGSFEPGHQNFGYIRIKGDAQAALCIPEAVDAVELGKFLIAVNSLESPIETVGCEKAFFPVEGQGERFMWIITQQTSERPPICDFGESCRFLSKERRIVASGSPHSGPL
jgi:hypothetical protein